MHLERALERLSAENKLTALPPRVSRAVGEAIQDAKWYLEWGTGGSTYLAAHLGVARFWSIESDPSWIDEVRQDSFLAQAERVGRLELRHVDLGEVGRWGWPKSPINDLQAVEYELSPVLNVLLEFEGQPGVAFVDGRFRVACAAAGLGLLPLGSAVIVDDYVGRPHYEDLALWAGVPEIVGRAAKFVVDKVARKSWWVGWMQSRKDPR